MDALNALTSVMTAAAFEADAGGHIARSNPPFVQLLRQVPGDDWRDGVAPEDRALVDTFWNALFVEPDRAHDPITFRLTGSDARFLLRAQAVTGDQSEATSAVGIIVLDDDAKPHSHYEIDQNTGLPDRSAVIHRIDELIGQGRNLTVVVVLLDAADVADDTRRKEAARQLLSTLRPSDVVSSSPDGGFLLCATDVAELRPALHMGERIAGALSRSGIMARIGLAVSDHDVAPATLVREAEAGAYAATPGDVRVAD